MAAPVEGARGTEFLFACGRRSGPVDAAEVGALLGNSPELPPLPGGVMVLVSRDHVRVEGSGRDGGEPRSRPDPEAEVVRRLEALCSGLRSQCEIVSGVAFAHR
jgi:hypothetical protein